MDALDVFRVGAEVGGVVYFVFEELVCVVECVSGGDFRFHGGGEGGGGAERVGEELTMPVTLLAMKLAGWFLLSDDNRK